LKRTCTKVDALITTADGALLWYYRQKTNRPFEVIEKDIRWI